MGCRSISGMECTIFNCVPTTADLRISSGIKSIERNNKHVVISIKLLQRSRYYVGVIREYNVTILVIKLKKIRCL